MTVKIKLNPSRQQAELFEKTFASCQYLWNRMIADEAKLQTELGRHFLPTPAKYKRELPALKEVDSLALSAVHRSLEKGFRNHSYNPHDHPRPEPVAALDAYTTYCQQTKYGPTIRLGGSSLKLPKVGEVAVEPLAEGAGGMTIKSATVLKSGGEYFCELACEAAANAPDAWEKLPA